MKLFNYIAKEIWKCFWLVLLVLISMQFFLTLLNELGDVGKGQYNFGMAVIFSLLELPARAYDFLPVMLFLGGLLAFGDLANHNELIVMRASGLSNKSLFAYVSLIALFMGLLTMSLFEFIAPNAQRYANFSKEVAISNGRVLKKGQSVWFKDPEFFIHVKHVFDKSHLRNVYVYHADQPGTVKSIAFIKKLNLEKGHWIAYDYQKSIFAKDRVESKQIARMPLPIHLNNIWLTYSGSKQLAAEMGLGVLWKRIKVLQQNHLNTGEWLYSLCQRLARPLVSVIMLMLALPFVLGSTRHQSLSMRLSIGLLIGLCYHFFNKFLYVFSMVYHVNPVLANAIPLILFSMITMKVWARVAR